MDDVLQLNALAPERKKVPLKWEGNPEGTEVELAVREDFGFFDHAELDRQRVELMQLQMVKSPTPAQKGRVTDLLNALVRKLIIGGPDEALRALPEATKEEVVNRFFDPSDSRLLRMLEDLDEGTIQNLLRLGTSLPGANASTAATPNSGGE